MPNGGPSPAAARQGLAEGYGTGILDTLDLLLPTIRSRVTP